ncbi:DUF2007 domain-containing protein [Thiobacter aerophilum]|uniref:DUF2007 domain-containing protein n=1 Tax=Thiobacter aerophilum TaxID=3121275 RepID=A0ABV0EB55_9BURK
MRRVYSAADLADAHILLGLLIQRGIAARVLQQHARGGLGELPFAETAPEVWIEDDADFERARAVVRAYETAHNEAASRRCPACGEASPASFDVCWNCGGRL